MKRRQNYFLIIAGACVLAASVGFSLQQRTVSPLSDEALASIIVGAGCYRCTSTDCGEDGCSEIDSTHCLQIDANEGQNDTDCPSTGAPGTDAHR